MPTHFFLRYVLWLRAMVTILGINGLFSDALKFMMSQCYGLLSSEDLLVCSGKPCVSEILCLISLICLRVYNSTSMRLSTSGLYKFC